MLTLKKITFKIHPDLKTQDTLFYRKNQSIFVDFSAEEISSDGSLILLEKLERENKIVLVVINKKILLTEYSSLGVIYFKP